MSFSGRHARPWWVLLAAASLASAANDGYVGREVCAGCHRAIALTQVRTNMARTWRGKVAPQFPPDYLRTFTEGPAPDIKYQMKRSGQSLDYQVQMPQQPALDFPIEALVGGDRHGISFLFRVPVLDGLALPKARLLEARYFHYATENRLAHSLGFPEEKPTTYETAFGRVLTPYLEARCLGCHGVPRTHGTHVDTGITCENCHGPGQAHVSAVAAHAKDLRIINQNKMPVPERMGVCIQCHSGSSVIEDPMPDDTLISDQVTALKNSECWRQTGGDVTCINCHNPHQDAPHAVLEARAEKTCLRCHSATAPKHAGLCPVNRTSGCATCHMADETRGAFVIAEHWIRVQPGQAKAAQADPAWRTTVVPKHLFLRKIVMDDQEKAARVRQRLLAGESFFDLARENSIERGTINGGYLGDLEAGQLDPAWSAAALKLEPGEISDLAEVNGKYVILQRMPRNFREDAEAVFNHAMELRKQGKQQESINEMLEALKIYPHLLRALTWLGAAYGQAGNPSVSTGILGIAAGLYPRDAGVHFNLGLAYGSTGDEKEISEYKRTIDIDPDYVLAYLNWGAALYAKGQYAEAIKIYRQGIDVNPLFASLHYSLGVALEQEKQTTEAAAEIALAKKIDPNAGAK